MYQDRIRCAALEGSIVSAQAAAELFKNGMTVGLSGFTKAGDCKALPQALAERARCDGLKLNVLTGASLGHDRDGMMADAGLLARRSPFQADKQLRNAINEGKVLFVDQHLSEPAESLRSGNLPPIDIAVVEALAIREDGSIVPTTSVGNNASFVQQARQVIVELNMAVPLELEGVHDIYLPEPRPGRQPIALTSVLQRIGTSSIPVDPEKIAAIVITDEADCPSSNLPADAQTHAIADHVIDFLSGEVSAGRLTPSLLPLQAGIGTIANAVMHGLLKSSFSGMTMYSEVLQDSTFELLDSGQMTMASASSVTLTDAMYARFIEQLDRYRSKLVLRPQEISNHPEIIRRLGIISINTALEMDIYGNVNSTHVCGTHMMNGIGGSGDFARNAHLSIFVSKSTTKNGRISRVVPMVSHVDHVEHDVDVLVTEWGLADLRGLAPRERAIVVIENCVDPAYREALRSYYFRACKKVGGHTPHLLGEVFEWHQRFAATGSMLESDLLVS